MGQLYDSIGNTYAQYRRPDPRIASMIDAALGGARSVVNVGAGTGSYEPADRFVVAVEPSETMIRQRPAGAAPALRASAIDFPFADGTFDAALAVFTVHHWPDQLRGLREMARVAARCVIFTWEPSTSSSWLTRDYFPEILTHDRNAFPLIAPLYGQAFAKLEIVPVPVPHDCSDGFLESYWRRPEMYLDPGARAAISLFAKGLAKTEAGLTRLRHDLDNGTWRARNGHLLERTELDLGYRLVIGER